MAPGSVGSPFRARWDATSVSLYSVVNEPGGLFFPSPCIPHFFSGLIALQWELFFRESSPHPIFHTFFAFGRKKYQTFLRKNGRHSLDFANRIKKISFAKSFFGQRKSRKRKPDRLIPVGALGKRFAAQRKYKHPLCCSFSVFLYILSLV